MRKVFCDYCGERAEFVDSKIVYGKSYGKIYLCRKCMAYVGVHKGTDIPLGRLANAELRYWKKAAHAAFDPIWKYGLKKRNEAYAWLTPMMIQSSVSTRTRKTPSKSPEWRTDKCLLPSFLPDAPMK